MRVLISVLCLLMSVSTISWAQMFGAPKKKYYDIADEDRITLLKQEVKKNNIDLSGYIKNDTLSKAPEFTIAKEYRQLKIPVDTAKNFEIEIEVTLARKKDALQIYGASRPEKEKMGYKPEEDILVRMDMWTDGIYNILQKVHGNILLGVGGLKKIRVEQDPDNRKITIRKINGEFEFYVNTNLILVILPPEPVNEIGFVLPDNCLEINSIMINYLVNFE